MRLLKPTLAVMGLALIGACEQQQTAAPTSAESVTSVETTAVVKMVDLEERQVLVEDANGRLQTIVAGPEVRNLEQVQEGDIVKAVHQQSVAVHMVQPGDGTPPAAAAVGVARAPEGERPAAMVGDAVSMVVQIVSFDPNSNLVVFTGPDGFVRSIVIQKPEMREFARGLKPGDEVEVTFTEALAVAVIEAPE